MSHIHVSVWGWVGGWMGVWACVGAWMCRRTRWVRASVHIMDPLHRSLSLPLPLPPPSSLLSLPKNVCCISLSLPPSIHPSLPPFLPFSASLFFSLPFSPSLNVCSVSAITDMTIYMFVHVYTHTHTHTHFYITRRCMWRAYCGIQVRSWLIGSRCAGGIYLLLSLALSLAISLFLPLSLARSLTLSLSFSLSLFYRGHLFSNL